MNTQNNNKPTLSPIPNLKNSEILYHYDPESQVMYVQDKESYMVARLDEQYMILEIIESENVSDFTLQFFKDFIDMADPYDYYGYLSCYLMDKYRNESKTLVQDSISLMDSLLITAYMIEYSFHIYYVIESTLEYGYNKKNIYTMRHDVPVLFNDVPYIITDVIQTLSKVVIAPVLYKMDYNGKFNCSRITTNGERIQVSYVDGQWDERFTFGITERYSHLQIR